MEEHLKLLKKYKFEKYLAKLNEKLKNKKVVIYGSGLFFKSVRENYDLSKLNVIGISDRKYEPSQEGQEDLGYKIIPYNSIIEYKPDCILIATLMYMNILKSFREEYKATKVKVYPLVDKPFMELLKEVL